MQAVLIHLVGTEKGKRERFNKDRISIGRAPDNDLHFNDGQRRVSSHHAEILRRGDGFLLHDLGSTNGTMVNGRRVITTELGHDDMIEFGAGGPVLRFGIEYDERAGIPESNTAATAGGGAVDRLPSAAQTKRSNARPQTRSQTRLILAIAAAMLIGAAGGTLLSSGIPGGGPERNQTLADVAQQNSPAVVFIRAEFELIDQDGNVKSTGACTGSGFIVSSSGFVVTNRHVVRDWEYNPPPHDWTGRITKLQIITPGQTRDAAVAAEVYRVNDAARDPDVAILQISPSQLHSVRAIQPDLEKISQGDEVAVIGYPLGLELLNQTHDDEIAPSLSSGIVSRVGQDFIQLNLQAYHGGSGGPVFNRKSEVIGILTGKIPGANDIALVTPIGAALDLIRNP